MSPDFGFERGTPVDRYYIEEFVEHHGGRIHGRVLEVGERLYVRERGAFSARQNGDPLPPVRSSVTSVDILDLSAANSEATVIADVGDPDAPLPAESFDCVLCIQTLQFVYDIAAALRNLHRTLKPGGSLIATLPGISQISAPEINLSPQLTAGDYPGDQAGFLDYWRFTPAAANALCAESFDSGDVVVECFGNVLTAVALLHGLTTEDLRPRELAHSDPGYAVIVGICATRGTSQ